MNPLLFLTMFLIGCSTTSSETLTPVLQESKAQPQANKPMKISEESVEKAADWKKFFSYHSETKANSTASLPNSEKVDMSNIDSLFAKASMLIQGDRFTEAESLLSDILRVYPDHLKANLAMASILLKKEELAQAQILLNSISDRVTEKALDSPVLFLQFRFLRALVTHKVGHLQESRSLFAEIISKYDDFAPAYVAMAQSYLDNNAPERALFVIKKGYQKAEKDVHLNNMMGVVFEKLGKQEEALHYFRKAVKLNPKYLPSMVNQARIYLVKRSLSASENIVNDILKLDPDNEIAHTLLAILLAEKGELELATDRLKSLHKKNPENAYIRFNLALLYGKNLNTQYLAQNLLDEVITLSGSDSILGKEATYQKSLNFSRFSF